MDQKVLKFEIETLKKMNHLIIRANEPLILY
jgi:hypothetical protein